MRRGARKPASSRRRATARDGAADATTVVVFPFDSVVVFVRKVPLTRVIAAAVVALSATACCSGDGADPFDAARNDASGDLVCPRSALTTQMEWQDSTCDSDGNCTDHVWVHVDGCGRDGVYDCTPCFGSYDCSRID